MRKIKTKKEKISILFKADEGFVFPSKHLLNFNYISVCPGCHTPNVTNEIESFYNDRNDFVTICPKCGERQYVSRGKLIYFSELKKMLIKISIGLAISLSGIYALDMLTDFVSEFLM